MLRVFSLLVLLFVTFGFVSASHEKLQQVWTAPAWADTLYNPYNIEPLTLPQAQEIYNLKCINCHGGQGQGFPIEHTSQEVPNFKQEWFKAQSDGAIYWKIREGRGVMPGYKSKLSEEQLWQLVEYVRDLSKPFEQQKNPFKALEE